MKALVIDDDPDIREIVSLCFEMRWPQTDVISASDAHEGLALLAENPDVIILDIELPGMNGFKACNEIRRCSDIPIIMLTVRDRPEDVSCGLEVGADDYIVKPFSYIELLSRVHTVLRRTQRLPVSNVPVSNCALKNCSDGQIVSR